MPESTYVPASTRWTLVLRADRQDPAARVALAELCELYWPPVFRFLRGEGRSEESARELTQEFFARLLRSGRIGAANPARGRFRSYLFGAVKHFLQDERDREQRQKRGGGQILEPLPDDTTQADGSRPASFIDPPSDAYFDREWALLVLDRSLQSLAAEMRSAGKSDSFNVLKPWLTGACIDLTQAEAAASLHLSEGAVKVAIHRLRHRFRELVRQEIASTVDRSEEIDGEVRYLVEALSHQQADDGAQAASFGAPS